MTIKKASQDDIDEKFIAISRRAEALHAIEEGFMKPKEDRSWLWWLVGSMILLALLWYFFFFPSVAEAKRNTVVVRDYTSDAGWTPVVERGVDHLINAMPDGGPRLVYKRMGKIVSCRDLKKPKGKHRVIRICSYDRHPNNSSIASATRSVVWLANDGPVRPSAGFWSGEREGMELSWAFCHEMMHALTGTGDYYQYGYAEPPYPEESCLWGWLPSPGPHDISLLREASAKRVDNRRRG